MAKDKRKDRMLRTVPGSQPGTSRSTAPTVTAKAREMIEWLRAHRDPNRAKGVQQYFKHEVISLGMATPVLRAYASDQAKLLVGRWGLAEATKLCGRLLQEPELEVRGAGILVLSAFRRSFQPVLARFGRQWLETRLDNWALVDTFCGSVLSPLLEQHPEVEATLREWSRARGLWIRRAALVTLVPFARRGQLLDTAYDLAREHFEDPEDLIHKAVGWLLREAGKTDKARLRAYLHQHGPAIPRTSVRYAIERFPESERRRLLEETRHGKPGSPCDKDCAASQGRPPPLTRSQIEAIYGTADSQADRVGRAAFEALRAAARKGARP